MLHTLVSRIKFMPKRVHQVRLVFFFHTYSPSCCHQAVTLMSRWREVRDRFRHLMPQISDIFQSKEGIFRAWIHFSVSFIYIKLISICRRKKLITLTLTKTRDVTYDLFLKMPYRTGWCLSDIEHNWNYFVVINLKIWLGRQRRTKKG